MRCTALLATVLIFIGAAHAACPPAGMAPDQLAALKKAPAGPADANALQPLALELLDCLDEHDPVLRDELGFELLATWMRAKALNSATLQVMRVRLLPALKPAGAAKVAGFQAPFAALTLAEIARVDRLTPFLSKAERADLLERAAQYLENIDDRRGFSDGEGWRHGVAHGADLLMQLALNAALDAGQQQRILAAVGRQVLADGEHVWQFGEGQRLMRPALFAAQRAPLTAEAWNGWLAAVLVPLGEPGAPLDARGLVRLHNAREFLWPLYVALAEQPDAALRERLLPAVREALKRWP